jgi:hypothetical protein
MANLSLANIRERPGRAETLVNKLKSKTPFDMVTGGTKIFDTLMHSSGGKIDLIVPSKSTAEFNKALLILKSKATSRDGLFLKNNSEQVRISALLKSGDFGGAGGSASGNAVKGNRGDMAEAIFAAAITARFMNKNMAVGTNHVIALIDRIDSNQKKQKMVYDSPNKNPKIMDKVTFELGLAESNLKALTDKSVQSTLKDIVNAAIKYANSSIVTSWSKLLFENNRFNEIEVISDGVGDQKGTKVDVRVKIDGKPTNINVSLKADDVKQFGQVGGSKFEAQQRLWDELLGLDVTSFETKYYEKIKKKNVVGAIEEIYSGAAVLFNAAVKTNKEALYKKLADGINYFATLREQNVTLVQLTRQEAQVYKFDNIEKLLKNVNLTAKLITTKKYPEINFEDDDGLVLITVRVKTENKPKEVYVRNYIEKGKLLTKLASFIAQ